MENWTEILYHAMATAAIIGAVFKFMWGRLDKRFDKIDERFDKIDERFDKIDERFDKVDGQLKEIRSDITKLECRVNRVEIIVEFDFSHRKEKPEPVTIDITDEQMVRVIEKTMKAIEERKAK